MQKTVRIKLDESMTFGQVVAKVTENLSDIVVMDFSSINHLSSPIIGAILAIATKIKSSGGNLIICELKRGFIEYLEVVDSGNVLKYVDISCKR
jgi:anti-anti-sigma regulatory factor